MSIHTPYNFVPLSKFIFLPAWADQVSHDLPFSDGVSGTLKLKLECHTPTLVGGQSTPATKEAPGEVTFFKNPDGQPTIPGTSIKGMLSNVMEIASFSRFNRLDDKRYSVRDLSSNSFYLEQFRTPPQSGWLTFNTEEGCWQITPCKMVRIHQKTILDHFKIKLDTWVKSENSQAHQRYQLLNGLRKFQKFNTTTVQYVGDVATPHDDGTHIDGTLVVTGQPGAAFNVWKKDRNGNDINKNKKWEFVFYANEENAKTVNAFVMSDFKFIHSESDDWSYWQSQRSANNGFKIPVFYKTENNKITSIGLSYLYRLAYKHTTFDAVKHTQISHIDSVTPDLPSLMFGQISNTPDQSLRGRVQVGCATLRGGQAEYKKQNGTILASPKPTYSPAYIRQPNGNTNGELPNGWKYKTFMDQSELAGWKRYPVKDSAKVMALNNDNKENTLVQVVLNPVKEGTCFDLSIKFHNLREAELGALLWSFDFGEQTDCFHSLGMGKPFGMGRISLTINEVILSTARASQQQGDMLLNKARASFVQLMTDTYTQVAPHSWQKSPQIKELLTMAQPTPHTGLPYMELNDYANSKGANANVPCVLQSHTKSPFQHDLDIQNSSNIQVNPDLNMLTDDDYLACQKKIADIARRKQLEKNIIEALVEEEKEASDEAKAVIAFEISVTHLIADPTNKTRKKTLVQQMRKVFKKEFFNPLDSSLKSRCERLLVLIVKEELFTAQEQLQLLKKYKDMVEKTND